MLDVWIKNARLLDLETGKESTHQLGTRQGKICGIYPEEAPELPAVKQIDAKNNYVFPGFIDFHAHLFQHGSGFGLDADRLLSAVVTMAVDMGTAGYANYPAFHVCDVAPKTIPIKTFLNLSPVGQPGKGINEPLDNGCLSLEKMDALLDAYPGEIVGIKVRISKNIVGPLGLEPLKKAVAYGEKLGLPVCVHTTNLPESAEAVAAILRPGDIYCHLYHGVGNTILDDNGRVLPGVLDAKKRGVLFDLGNGKMNFTFQVAEAAIRDGLFPDFISSDSTQATFHSSELMWDLPRCMSKLWSMGMPFTEVIRSVTETPASFLGLAQKRGKIAVGYRADLTICQVQHGNITFGDSSGVIRTGNQWLEPQTTLLSGRVVWEKEK